MISPIKFKGVPDMTDAARDEYKKFALMMGMKTKKEFTHALHIELYGRVKNSILNAGDIIRIAEKYVLK